MNLCIRVFECVWEREKSVYWTKKKRKKLSTTAHGCFFVPFLPTWEKLWEKERRKMERLYILEYRLLFCVTLISPWPNLFPQRSPEKLLGSTRKCAAQKTQSCCDRRSCCKMPCRESWAFVKRSQPTIPPKRPFHLPALFPSHHRDVIVGRPHGWHRRSNLDYNYLVCMFHVVLTT